MNRTLNTLALLTLTSLAATAAAQTDSEAADETLAPFFFVQADDPSVDQLPLKAVSVQAQIVGVIADIVVRQTYVNLGEQALEAIYLFPASTRAAVYGMEMRLGNRRIRAQIKEREAARQEYEQAKEEGRTASLLEEQRPNVFQMNVANILPGDTIDVELRYTELLVPTEGVYEFVYPTVVGPRYTEKTETTALPQDLYTKTPYQREGEAPLYSYDIRVDLTAGLPIADLQSPSHGVDIEVDGERMAVTLAADQGYGGNRDFVLQYQLSGDRIQSGLLLFEGEQESFFLAMAQPPARVMQNDVLPRDYVFIIDKSGSMRGFPLEVSKTLIRDLVSALTPQDTFNLLLFAGTSALLSPTPLPASAATVDSVLAMLDGLSGGGGTRLLPAMERALALPRSTQNLARTLVIATDGYVAVEAEAFDLIRQRLGEASFFAFGIGSSVNRFLIEGLARVGMGEPFIVLDSAEAPAAAARFRQYVTAPVLTRVRFETQDLEVYDREPISIPDVLAERPVIVFGKWRGERRGTVRIAGQTATGPYEAQFAMDAVEPDPSHRALRYLWARHRIALLSDYNRLYENQERVDEVTRLGLEYGLLTPYTSFVAVDELIRSDGTVETVQQPQPLPEGVPDEAIGDYGSTTAVDAVNMVRGRAESVASRPGRPTLAQNIPNPFNASTVVGFFLPTQYVREVRLVIYDLAGQVVRNVRPGPLGPGHHTWTWDGTDDRGRPVASGVYIYRIEGAVLSSARRMVLVR